MPEGVHQMRVGVRRLRAVLSAFGEMLPEDERQWASAELRWLGVALGAARNLDVFEHALLEPAQSALGNPEGSAELTAAAERRRVSAYTKAKRAVRSRRYALLKQRLLPWLDSGDWQQADAAEHLKEPIAKLARHVLDRRRRVAQRRSRHFANQSGEKRHRLRIALKKLRYASEVLADLYPKAEVGRFTQRLKRLQDDLGDANDLRVGHELVTELTKSRRAPRTMADAGETLLDWHERRLAKREPKLRRHLDELLETEPFWEP